MLIPAENEISRAGPLLAIHPLRLSHATSSVRKDGPVRPTHYSKSRLVALPANKVLLHLPDYGSVNQPLADRKERFSGVRG